MLTESPFYKVIQILYLVAKQKEPHSHAVPKFLIWSGRRDSNSRPLVPEVTKYNFIAIYRELGEAEKSLAICLSRYYALNSLNWFYKFLKIILDKYWTKISLF